MKTIRQKFKDFCEKQNCKDCALKYLESYKVNGKSCFSKWKYFVDTGWIPADDTPESIEQMYENRK